MDAALANGINTGLNSFQRGISLGNDIQEMRARRQDRQDAIKSTQIVTLLESTGDAEPAVAWINSMQEKEGVKPDDPKWVMGGQFDQKTGALTITKKDGTVVPLERDVWRGFFPRAETTTGDRLRDRSERTKTGRRTKGIPDSADDADGPGALSPMRDPKNPLAKARTEKEINETLGTYFDSTLSDPAAWSKAVNIWKYNQEQGTEVSMADIEGVVPGLKRKQGVDAENTDWSRFSTNGASGAAGGLPTEDQPIRGGPAYDANSTIQKNRGIPTDAAVPAAAGKTVAQRSQPKALDQKAQMAVAKYRKIQTDAANGDQEAAAWLKSDAAAELRSKLEAMGVKDIELSRQED